MLKNAPKAKVCNKMRKRGRENLKTQKDKRLNRPTNLFFLSDIFVCTPASFRVLTKIGGINGG